MYLAEFIYILRVSFVNNEAALSFRSVIVTGDAAPPHLLNPPPRRFCLHTGTPFVGERWGASPLPSSN